ncbi:MAG: DUF3168 domain-containing protein [Anaerolineales bacterium]|nr:DUF3168 domain-containing protein [Anaerolineales bacterium]
MSILTATIFDRLAGDIILTGMLSEYKGIPAIFTTDPAPGDAILPYIVTAGEVTQSPWDTKTTRGRSLTRDVRCYADADGSAVLIETIAERVRALLHRQALAIGGYQWVISDCGGPIVADEPGSYARIISLSLTAQEV